jgi:hypothetical protein
MSSVVGEAVAVSRVTVDRGAMDAVAAKKAVDDAATAERAVVDKRVAYAVAQVKVVDDEAAAERATAEATSRDVAESSPAPAVGAKRDVVSSGSTPPTKRQFHGSYNPQYVVGCCICLSFTYAYFVSLGFFVVQCVSPK